MHPKRKEAQAKFERAAQAKRKAEMSADESAYNTALEEYNLAAKELSALEVEFPTTREYARKSNKLYLHNIGIRD